MFEGVDGMNREDWIWVAVKVFGIYLLLLAVTGVPSLVSSTLYTWAWQDTAEQVETDPMSTQDDTGDRGLGEILSKAAQRSLSSMIGQLVRLVLFTGLGIYLLKSGKVILRVACRDLQPSGGSTGNL